MIILICTNIGNIFNITTFSSIKFYIYQLFMQNNTINKLQQLHCYVTVCITKCLCEYDTKVVV